MSPSSGVGFVVGGGIRVSGDDGDDGIGSRGRNKGGGGGGGVMKMDPGVSLP